ncbi:MAG: hypothetical protein KGJ23_11925 [Euryarchaeota archaeon]|nr:hypothetical protein [Euryarchaeota archaeon]MDE1837304.1 hypothetical protein [Euryarchaeota archaeon]MDE1879824.1 hypothetical protein [Euryarchaeota archaeon]MDE2045265.1 hypothetical protein [Thermoplasmata archaeon]
MTWLTIGFVVAVVLSSTLFAVEAAVPVSHQLNFSFSIVDPGGYSAYNRTMTFTHAGSVTFSYATLGGSAVNLFLLNGTRVTIYQTATSTGGFTFPTTPGETFTFGISTWAGETANIQGTETYFAPTLGP